jgi:hypothetical protein
MPEMTEPIKQWEAFNALALRRSMLKLRLARSWERAKAVQGKIEGAISAGLPHGKLGARFDAERRRHNRIAERMMAIDRQLLEMAQAAPAPSGRRKRPGKAAGAVLPGR